ncbi:MAG: hypothetical protein FWF54_07720 [Candidatus Azobacteroides sp.]|nr:hypothetical protein [Candidatus Azobacteroides sp.]
MKIIQTLWTKPSFSKNSEKHIENRLSGGWLKSKYYYFAMAYSCLTLRKYYDNVELVTDDFGIDLLINKLKLPYTSVKVLPNYFNSVPVGLWALPKIYSYSIQDEPFLHVDNDIFIWDKLCNENAALLVQNFEKISGVYDFAIKNIQKHCKKCPDFLDGLNVNDYQSINAGVFGGNDIKFIKYYTNFVFNFVNLNLKNLTFNDSGVTNVIYEQLFFYQLAKQMKKTISTVVSEKFANNITNFVKFEQIPFSSKYIHCLGGTKGNYKICKQIELRLCDEYPKEYEQILKYLKINNNTSKTIQMANYQKASKIFSGCKQKEDILYIPLKLSPNIEIVQKNNKYYLIEGRKQYILKNWNKMLLFFYGQFRTAEDLLKDFANSDLSSNFDSEDLKDNIISVISYHSLYYNRFVSQT